MDSKKNKKYRHTTPDAPFNWVTRRQKRLQQNAHIVRIRAGSTYLRMTTPTKLFERIRLS